MIQEESGNMLHVLMLEDSSSDVELFERELQRAGIAFTSKYVDSQETFTRAIKDFHPSVILSKYELPTFDGLTALKMVRRDHPEIPVVIIADELSEGEAIDLIHAGAKDFVLKSQLSKLPLAVLHVLTVEQGIRERKAAEQTIRENEIRLNGITAATLDAIIMLDDSGCISFWNAAAERIFGYSAAEALGKELHPFLAPSRFLDAYRQNFAYFGQTGEGTVIGKILELTALRKDGSEFPIELSISAMKLKEKWHAVGVLRDISARKQRQQELSASRSLLSTIIESAPIRVFWKDTELRYLGCNTEFAHDAGMSHPEELIGKDDFQMGWRDQAELYRADDRQVMESGNPKIGYEEPQTTPGGHTIWLRTSKVPLRDDNGKVFGMLGIYEEITKWKNAELEREQYFKFFNASNDLMGIADPNGAFKKVNPAFLSTLGYSEDEILSKPFIEFIHSDDRQSTLDEMARQLERGYSLNFENRYVCKDGSLRWLSWRAHVNFEEKLTYATARDVTDEKAAERELLRLNRTLKTISSGNHTMLHASNEADLMKNICEVITSSRDYELAWIGFVRKDKNKSIEVMAASGPSKEYVKSLQLSWDDCPAGHGPTGTAVRTGKTQIAQDIQNESRMEPWKEAAAHYGHKSSIALPLKVNEAVIGALSIYAAQPFAFNTEEVALLEEVASDLAFGIESLRTHDERTQYAQRLRTSLEETLQAFASTVEMRDPYTSGHQRRVADLAVAIARELSVPEDQVHGIHLSGMVHDLGKMHIPSEILNRPGKLSELELNLIKTHAQAGYDILKGIQFPWPIAQAVLQHHEHLDGSGYPQGLKDGQIILEAKILTVADVVEAITSHRPYRPGLGNDAALYEIKKNRGIFYDPAVVDACVKLFTEKKYQLPPV